VSLLRVLDSPEAEASASDISDTLTRVADELARNGLHVESAVRPGKAADEIVKHVQAQAVNLVIMRTRGRSGVQRAVLGSVGERLMSETDVPVMLLRPGGRRMVQITQILVPVDGSPGGALALSHAAELAKVTGARIRLVEVVVPMAFHMLSRDTGTMPYYDPAWDDEALAAAQTYVEGMLARVRAAGVVAEGDARTAPDISGAIVQAADDFTCDLIVMSTHALTGPARALLGSVSDAVVRNAHRAVLLPRRGRPGDSIEAHEAEEDIASATP